MTTLQERGYDEIKIIGRGQYGKAHLVSSGGQLAIAKTIDLTCLSNKERETALQEVQLLRRLDHPNIVKYKNNFFMGDTLVIVMQYCEGGDLAMYIKDMAKKKLRIQEVQIMNYLVQVVQALQYIHSERILHRDLKTSNLFLMQRQSIVKLGDFGISRVLEGSIEAAITVVGTPYYMSPEVCENKPYTYKSDVWSLGCVLYELCMLKHAFFADNLLGLVYKIVSDKYEPIPEKYSKQLNVLIQRMLEKNAERRMSVREILADPYVQSFMQEYVRTRGQCVSTPSGPPSRASFNRAGTAGTNNGGSGGGGKPATPPSVTAPVAAPMVAPPPSAPPGRTRPCNGGHAAPVAAGSGGGGPAQGGGGSSMPAHRAVRPAAAGARMETPKEAALRRKFEAADRKAEEMKVAAARSVHNKQVARMMKEKVEFGATSLSPAAAAIPRRAGLVSPASAALSDDDSVVDSRIPGGQKKSWPYQAASAASTAVDDCGSGSETPEEDLEPPLEEISEAESSDEEDYEDDFENDACSDEISEGYSDVEEEEFLGNGVVLSAVREEQDFSRVMSNYEHGITEISRSNASPPPRRVASVEGPRQQAAPAVSACSGFRASLGGPNNGGFAATGGCGAMGGGVLDKRERVSRLEKELINKMGEGPFQLAFGYLLEARTRTMADEKTVKMDLERLIGRDVFRAFGFEIDQLVFHATQSQSF